MVEPEYVLRTSPGLPAQDSVSKAQVSCYGTLHLPPVALDDAVNYIAEKAIVVSEQATWPRHLGAMVGRRGFLAVLIEVELVDAATEAAAGAWRGHTASALSLGNRSAEEREAWRKAEVH